MADNLPPYVQSLIETRAHLQASIAARESRKAGQSDDYNEVTKREGARVAEVETELRKLGVDLAALDQAIKEALAPKTAQS